MKILRLLPLLFVLLLFSCEDDSPVEPLEPVIENVVLTDYALQYSRSASEIRNIFKTAGVTTLDNYLEYKVTLYKIDYKTDYLGEEITASGLVGIPDTEEAVPIMSFQRGTMASHAEAPTSISSNYGTLASFASAGYIMILPDLIGFGSSSDVMHPYYNESLSASAVIDMIRAAKELAREEGSNFNGEVFLSGYSEGGYVTMAAHKSMEENPIEGFELIASAPSSGGYDVKGMQEYFFSLETYDNPFFLGFVTMSYQSTEDLGVNLDQLYNEPYATNMASYFDGSMNGDQINALLTDNIADLLHADFLSGIDTNPDYATVVASFEKNSMDDWVPQTRMMLYHGNADVTVPYQNSVDTYDKMISLGASKSVLTFTTLEGANHGSGFFPYIVDVVEQFDPLK